jgi:hypothetical protein
MTKFTALRTIQVACLMVLALMMNASYGGAAEAMDPGACPSRQCSSSCDLVGLCYTAGSCDAMGCTVLQACGESGNLYSCDCPPCN